MLLHGLQFQFHPLYHGPVGESTIHMPIICCIAFILVGPTDLVDQNACSQPSLIALNGTSNKKVLNNINHIVVSHERLQFTPSLPNSCALKEEVFYHFYVQIVAWVHPIINFPFESVVVGEEPMIHDSSHDHPRCIKYLASP